jgi:hypothetical protein
MRTGRTLTGIAAASLLAAGLIAAAPAYASSGTHTVFVQGATTQQYNLSCLSQSTCNTVTTGTMQIQFGRTGTSAWVSHQPALGVFYQITNGTAVDGTDFNVPMTGEVIIPAGQFNQYLAVPLVNEHQFGTSKAFTIAITGTTGSITINPTPATGTITGGNIPLDCSFAWISSTSQSLTCTQRPPAQVWNLRDLCFRLGMDYVENGNQVTGNGISTVSDCLGVSNQTFIIVS